MGGMIVYDKFVWMWCQLLASSAMIRELSRWLSGKNLPANAGDTGGVGLIPGLGRPPGGENGNPFQHPCQEVP